MKVICGTHRGSVCFTTLVVVGVVFSQSACAEDMRFDVRNGQRHFCITLVMDHPELCRNSGKWQDFLPKSKGLSRAETFFADNY
jgi:hypothetical protein